MCRGLKCEELSLLVGLILSCDPWDHKRVAVSARQSVTGFRPVHDYGHIAKRGQNRSWCVRMPPGKRPRFAQAVKKSEAETKDAFILYRKAKLDPKNGNETGWRAKATGPFVLESDRGPKVFNYQYYRCEETFKTLLGWLREKGVQGNMPFHALRKLYGSALAKLHGIHAVSSGLRHADLRTTSESYADRTVKVTTGLGGAVLGPPAVLTLSSAMSPRARV